jgi:hypothetical protein
MSAIVAGLDVAAEGSGTACSKSLHDAPLRTRERTLVLRTIGVTTVTSYCTSLSKHFNSGLLLHFT